MTLSSSTSSTQSPWETIFACYHIDDHDFDTKPFLITAKEIGAACQNFTRPSEKEARILCKQDTRESRPKIFQDAGLFILPISNGKYVIVKGEGYVDIPAITSPLQDYHSDFSFELKTSAAGNSEMQHLDYAYALSLIRHFIDDKSLVLTIRGRKYTPKGGFGFKTNGFCLSVQSVQTEVDSGYEGRERVVLVEAKAGNATNTIIRQLYYPFRQWGIFANKPVSTLFFQRVKSDEFHIWQFGFEEPENYDSIRVLKSCRFRIIRQP